MDDNFSISQGPNFAGRYMPYFYSSGKFLQYDISHRDSNPQEFSQNSGRGLTNHIVKI